MARLEIDLKPVTHILADAIGSPGERVFYLQAWQNERLITLIVEKIQLQSLAVGLEGFLADISAKYPALKEASAHFEEDKMHIHLPLEPLFRVGELGLGYDAEEDLLILVAREVLKEGQDSNEAAVVRFWCTRSQLRALTHWSLELAARGRPTCTQCGEPIDPAGHFCPKKNGRQK